MTKKEYILSVASRQIKEKGYLNLSVKSICEEGYISKSTFYYNFDSLNDLLWQCFSQDYVVPQNMKRLISQYQNPLDRLYAFHILNIQHSVDLGPDRLSFYFRELLFGSKSSGMIVSSVIADRTVIPFIKECQKKDLISNKANPEELSEIIRKQMMGCSFDWAGKNGTYNLIDDTMDSLSVIYGVSPDYSWEKIYSDILAEGEKQV